MGRSILNGLRYLGEGILLLGLAAMTAAVALPLFQIQQTLKGNPLWFLPKHDKSQR